MNFQIHAALARQAQEQIARRTRATRPLPGDARGRRARVRLRPTRFYG